MDIGILLSILYEQCESIEECEDLLQGIEELNEINYLSRIDEMESK